MAFRILGTGTIETDTPAEVVALFGAMGVTFLGASSSPRLLTSGLGVPGAEIVIEPEIEQVARRRSGKTRRGGGGGKASVKPARRGSATRAAYLNAVIVAVGKAVRGGTSKPSDIVTVVAKPKGYVRLALRELMRRGELRAEGATFSRRYYPVRRSARQSAAPAKEGL